MSCPDRLCHRSVAAWRLCQQRSDPWVNLETPAVRQRWLTPRWISTEVEGEGDGGVGMRQSCGLCRIFAGRDTVGRLETDKHTWTDGDLEEDWHGERERENEGEKLTDVQTNKLWEWGGWWSQRQLGCWWKTMINNNNQKKSIIVIQLAYLRVLWTTILADLLQTRLLAKSWPRKLRGRPGRCGSFLHCLSQHGWGLCWLWLSEWGLSE